MHLWQSWIVLLSSLAIASCANAPPIPPPPEEPEVIFDDPTCVSCGYLLQEPELSQKKILASDRDKDAAFRVYLHYVSAENRAESAAWLQRAAELGHPTAQYNMWFELRESENCGDRATALSWLERSAAQGDTSANSEIKAYRAEVEGCGSIPSSRPN
jgi:hypothetical protein